MDIHILITGFVVGTLIGLTGMGGGTIMSPILIFFMGIKPTIAVGTDLVFAAVTKTLGATAHHRQRTVDYRIVKTLLSGSLPGALAGVGILHLIRDFGYMNVDFIMKRALSLMILFVAASMIYRSFFATNGSDCITEKRCWSLDRKGFLVTAGFIVGMLVSITSVGSGTLIILIFSTFYRFCPRRMVGTDIMHGLLLTAFAGILHAGIGHLDYSLLINLLAGSLPGVYLGSVLCFRLPEKALKFVLAGSLFAVGLKLF